MIVYINKNQTDDRLRPFVVVAVVVPTPESALEKLRENKAPDHKQRDGRRNKKKIPKKKKIIKDASAFRPVQSISPSPGTNDGRDTEKVAIER